MVFVLVLLVGNVVAVAYVTKFDVRDAPAGFARVVSEGGYLLGAYVAIAVLVALGATKLIDIVRGFTEQHSDEGSTASVRAVTVAACTCSLSRRSCLRSLFIRDTPTTGSRRSQTCTHNRFSRHYRREPRSSSATRRTAFRCGIDRSCSTTARRDHRQL